MEDKNISINEENNEVLLNEETPEVIETNTVSEECETAEAVEEIAPQHDVPVFEDDVPLAIHEILYADSSDEGKTAEEIEKERARTEKALYLATSEAEDRRRREHKEMLRSARVDAKEAKDIDRLIRKSQDDLDAGVEEAEILLADL